MLEKLFGNGVIEKILFFLLTNEKSYGVELARSLDVRLNSIQKALARLEDGGIICAQQQGRTRLYEFNPCYPFKKELVMFLEKAYEFIPPQQKDRYYEKPIRKRPRARNKTLKIVEND